MKPHLTNLTNRFAPENRGGSVAFGPRHTGPGSVAWPAAEELWQPQDGALNTETQISAMTSLRQRGSFAKLNEPEDAGLTGMTRSLGRRLLGLNIAGKPKPVARETSLAKLTPPGTNRTQVA
ncbi:MAG TPA: hypothetical protein VGN16_08095 [Acidobacteriaceae bacterium]|jgi:hypothetical protein